MYLNAAWWYFSMLIQFYLIFPLLFWAAQRLRTVDLFVNRVRRRIFRALSDAHRLSARWIVDTRRLRDLPAAGIRLGHGAGNVAQPINRAAEWFLLRGAGLVTGLLLYPAALRLYHNGLTYIFVDLGTSACCFLVIVGVAGIISRFAGPAKVFGLVGAFSYGLYLVHQPYVIWLGLRIREQPIWMFLLIAAATLTVLSAWGIVLEKATNALVNKLLPAKRKA